MKIIEIIQESTHLIEANMPELRVVLRALRNKGWTKSEGSSHEIWHPPVGGSTTDGTPHIAIPRHKCNPNTLR